MDTTTAYCPICGVERDAPEPLLRGMAVAADAFSQAQRSSFSPTAEGAWSPLEVLAHMADTEIVFGWRIRQILTEPDPAVASYDEGVWAESFFYLQRDAAIAAETFRATRIANVEILSRIDDAAWERAYRQGDARRTLRELVRHRADHDLQHLPQMAGG